MLVMPIQNGEFDVRIVSAAVQVELFLCFEMTCRQSCGFKKGNVHPIFCCSVDMCFCDSQ